MSTNESAAKRARSTQSGPQPPRFIVIEGPLRVGKTTLARILAERLHARRVYDCEDNPFLADFYKEKPGSGFRAQMYFLMERQKRIREALAVEAPGPVLSDFLMEKDRIFANLNLDDEELKLYERYYESLTADIPAPDLVVYLQAKPEVLRARIAKKASRDESQIAPEYVEEVARAYEHFFFRYAASDLLVINTSDIDFVERSEDLQQLLRRLQDPVKGTQYFLPLGASEQSHWRIPSDVAPPAAAEALSKYLELAPDGDQAVEVRQMLSYLAALREPQQGIPKELREIVEKEIERSNAAVPGDDKIGSCVRWLFAGGSRYPWNPSGIA